MGLLQRVETVDGLLPRAYEIAAKLASKDPAGLCAAKWSSNEVEFMFADFEAAQRAIEERAWRS
jgi:enoyl-CoA hydratase/carnithine racemase